MNRYWLLGVWTFLLLSGIPAPEGTQHMQSRGAYRTSSGLPHVDRARLQNTILTLGEIGRNPATGGVNRTAFSAADMEARRWFITQLEAAGLEVRIDPIANIIATLPGTDPDKVPIVIGSHLDSVPEGGRFDGALGLMIGLELVQGLRELNISLAHPLEIVSFSDEEGGLLGSRGWIGTITEADLAKSYSGRILRQVLQDLGLDPDQTSQAQRAPGEIAAYLEVHIEQGRVLERENLQIGVVEGIVALDEYEITVMGVANHAGTTRMADRQDPMAAAARMITLVREEVYRLGGNLVATVGKIEAEPGAPNVIPAVVRFTVDIRDPSRLVMEEALRNLHDHFDSIAGEEGVQVVWRTLAQIPPAPADPAIKQAILDAVAWYGYPHKVMPSGAGHDAQSIAAIAPMGMIFAPSVGGLSHTPAEFTRFEDAAASANVLLQTLLLLDERLP